MKIVILKYGNLMGSPDMKKMMYSLEPDNAAIDKLWDDCFAIKIAFGQNGQSTSVLLLEPACPALFPALVDCSYLCSDPTSYTDATVTAALDAIRNAGVAPDAIKSHFITHPHGDHLDPRLSRHLPNAKLLAHPDSAIPGVGPITPDMCPPNFVALDTPGHGTPHSSFIVDIEERNLSVCIAGDLIMSHAHFLSLDHPKSFSDHATGAKSVERVMSALAARGTKYKMILPGHDMPFFVQ